MWRCLKQVWPGLWIQHWFNADPDPAFFLIADSDNDTDPEPVPNPGFWWQKVEKNYSSKTFKIFFGSKITIYLYLGLHKGCASYRRSLQSSRENIHHFKTWKFFNFSIFVGHFCPPGSGSSTQINTDQCGAGSTTLGLTVSAGSEKVLGSIPASSDTHKSVNLRAAIEAVAILNRSSQ